MSRLIASFILAATMILSPLSMSAQADDTPAVTQEVQEATNTNVFKSVLPENTRAGVSAYLQDISVTIVTNRGEGSGVVKSKKDEHGNVVNFVWTAAHVVDSLRSVRNVIDPKTGTSRQIVEFADAFVVKDIKQNGRSVGQLKLAAEVVRYSDADTGHDLALLRIRKNGFIESSAAFYTGEIPAIGTDLFHVGSLLGQMGSNSMTTGIVSQQGRLIGGGNKKVFDQTTCPGFPGSSGGGVFTTDGRYMGMLVRGAGETFNLIVPVRRMRNWVKEANIEWAMSDDPMPTDKVMETLPIEDVGKSWNAAKAARAAADAHAPATINGVQIKDLFGRYPAKPALKEEE
jgi:S1-C subfamily serine protease